MAAAHINEKVGMLAKAGIHTLGDLVDEFPKDLSRLPGIGRRAVEHFSKRLDHIDSSVDADGEIDWTLFCKAAAVPILPSASLPRSGTEFLASLPGLVRGLADVLIEPLEQAILFDRLTRHRDEQRTLEDLAGSLPVPMTRERVRQREKQLLDDLSDALLFDEYPDLQLRFDAAFSGFWKAAMNQLPAAGEMSFEAFCRCLCSCWQVTADELFDHLPFVTVVLTSRAQIPPAMRATRGLDTAVIKRLPPAVLSLPVQRLPIGRHVDQLADAGITDVGTLIEAFRYKRLAGLHPSLVERAKNLLPILASAISPDGALDWEVFAEKTGTRLVPAATPSGAEGFLLNLTDTVALALREGQITRRGADIFLLRTSKPQGCRPTLEATGNILNTIGPTVKMEETRFLAALHRQLVTGYLSTSAVQYRSEYLDWWSDAARLHHSAEGDYDLFRRLISHSWRVSPAALDAGVATLWSVIGRYPHGRAGQPGRRKLSGPAKTAASSSHIIVLRGFRRVH